MSGPLSLRVRVQCSKLTLCGLLGSMFTEGLLRALLSDSVAALGLLDVVRQLSLLTEPCPEHWRRRRPEQAQRP